MEKWKIEFHFFRPQNLKNSNFPFLIRSGGDSRQKIFWSFILNPKEKMRCGSVAVSVPAFHFINPGSNLTGVMFYVFARRI